MVSLQREVDEDVEEENVGKVVCPRYGMEKTEVCFVDDLWIGSEGYV